jgi:histone acetyltransferase (RNA polymerase elongator complex component)
VGQSHQPTKADVKKAVEVSMRYSDKDLKNTEIAFFGGSFTALKQDYMVELLEEAYKFIIKYGFYGIRISTRPDCINKDILGVLKSYKVSSIELGAQSMDDKVLLANNRGHTSKDVVLASKLIKEYGISLGLQMMTGLYKSTDNIDIKTAKSIIDLKPDTVRIYPTVVLKNTKLENLFSLGKYNPPGVYESAKLCAKLLLMFNESNIKVIRVGLHDSEKLKNEFVGGAYHPAFRELCEGQVFYERITNLLNSFTYSKDIKIIVNSKSISKVKGHKKCNIEKLKGLGYNPLVEIDDKMLLNEVKILNCG